MENTCNTENSPKTFKEYVRSRAMLKSVGSIAAGALLGYTYYYFIGCNSGSCAITSSPGSSILFGAFLGFFIVNKPCKTC